MEVATERMLQAHLVHRRQGLQSAIKRSTDTTHLVSLLKDVDAALERMESGSYGICDICRENIGETTLRTDPLMRICLSHLTDAQRLAIERDLELASQIQHSLLPAQPARVSGWEVHYRYEPAGPVSGDYCDLIDPGTGEGALFLLGDVTGKGVAASLLMSHLHAIFRSLNTSAAPVHDLVRQANGIFSTSALSGHFATLVCGRLEAPGTLQICNAGHCPPFLIRGGKVQPVESTGTPIGLFRESAYTSADLRMEKGDTLLLYTDGLSETRDMLNTEYGAERLAALLSDHHAQSPDVLLERTLSDLRTFQSQAPRVDDLTVMVVRRTS